MTRKLSDNLKVDLVYDLINAFGIIRKPDDVANFLEDLLTPSEVRNLSVRLRIAKLLLAGKTQREIATALNTSLATTNKVNNWLIKSGQGFKKVVSNLPLHIDKPEKIPKGPIEYHLPEIVAGGINTAFTNIQEKQSKKLITEIKLK